MVEKCWSKQQDESKASAAATVDSKPMEKSAREGKNYTFAVSTNEVRLTTDHWVFDSAATSHMTPNRASSENPCPIDQVMTVGGGYQL